MAKLLSIPMALFHPWEFLQDNQIHLLLSIVVPSIFKTLSYLCHKGVEQTWSDKRSCQSYESFHKALPNFIRPSENKIFNIHNQVGIKLLTRLRLGLSLLRQHKFRHNFEDTLNPLCSCCIEAETALHFFLRYQFFNDIREILMNDLTIIDRSPPLLSQDKLIGILLYGRDAFDNKKNHRTLICTIQFIKDSHRFDNSLF